MTDVEVGEPISTAVALAVALLLLGLAACLFRVWRGPSTADRVVALDLVAYHVIGVCALVALGAEDVDLLAPGLVLALLAFLATVAFARHLERGAMR